MAPAPEVIQEWADHVPLPGAAGAAAGPYTFERGRMSEAIQAVCVDMVEESKKKQAKLAAEKAQLAKKVRKEDVEFLVSRGGAKRRRGR